MPRPRRNWERQACYHISHRCHNRELPQPSRRWGRAICGASDFPAPAAVTYTYHPESDWLHTTTFPNGLTATREPEAKRNLVDSVRNNLAGTTVSEYDYTNDPAGRRTDVVMTGTAFNQSTFNAYDYNDRNEVVGGQKYQGVDPNDKTNPVPSCDYDYKYDPIGNRQTFTESGTQTTYTTNPLNQYTQLSSFPTQPSHDLDGNMTFLPSTSGGGAGGEGWHCQWNGENRLIRAEENSSPPGRGRVRVEYQYDYMGRRVRKRSYSGSAILGWTLDEDLRYIYNNWNLIAQLSLQPSSLIPDKTYTWGLDLSQTRQGAHSAGSGPSAGGVGGLLATRHPSTSGGGAGGEGSTYCACYDANGNISEYLAPDGTIAAHYEYSPFGQLTVTSCTTPETFAHRFSTKYHDIETKLYYYGYRYYSPELGRWGNRDPQEEGIAINLYALVGNGPTNTTDVLGLYAYLPPLPTPLHPAPGPTPPALGPGPAPAPSPSPAPGTCKIEVCCSSVSIVPSAHCVIRFTDDTGFHTGCRAGPSRNGPSGSSSGEPEASAPTHCDECCSSWGTITTACGEGSETSPDGAERRLYEDLDTAANNPGSCTTITESAAACAVESCVQSNMSNIESSCYRYRPFGPNSNTAWYSALAPCLDSLPYSLPDPNFPGWQPGWREFGDDQKCN